MEYKRYNKRALSIFIGLCLWVIGGSLFFQQQCCVSEASSTRVLATLFVADGLLFNVTSTRGLLYKKNSPEVIVPASSGLFLDSLANHLSQNPLKLLTIRGFYAPSEEKKGLTLGLKRAQSIQTLLVERGCAMQQLKLKPALSNNIELLRDTLSNAIQLNFSSKYTITARDEASDFSLEFKQPIVFGWNKSIPTETVHTRFTRDLTILATYLIKSPNRILNIAGRSHQKEKNSSWFQELGTARANIIQAQLRLLGVPQNQLSTSITPYYRGTVILSSIYNKLIPLPYEFSFREQSEQEALNQRNKTLLTTPFLSKGFAIRGFLKDSTHTAINPSPQLRKYITQLNAYLTADSTRRVICTGVANMSKNKKAANLLSFERAYFVRDKLIQQSLNPKQILIKSTLKSVFSAKNRLVQLSIREENERSKFTPTTRTSSILGTDSTVFPDNYFLK